MHAEAILIEVRDQQFLRCLIARREALAEKLACCSYAVQLCLLNGEFGLHAGLTCKRQSSSNKITSNLVHHFGHPFRTYIVDQIGLCNLAFGSTRRRGNLRLVKNTKPSDLPPILTDPEARLEFERLTQSLLDIAIEIIDLADGDMQS